MFHFVSSPREREKRHSRGDEREGQGRKRKMNSSEETEVKKNPSLPLPATRIEGIKITHYGHVRTCVKLSPFYLTIFI